MISKYLRRCFPAECFSRPTVECSSHRVEFVPRVSGQIGALGEVLAQETIGVLVGASLPRAVWVAEVDRQSCLDSQLDVLRHLGALVPRQGSAQVRRQRDDRGSDRVSHRLRAVASERGPFFTRGCPKSVIRGRCSSNVNRVLRSTRVPIAELSSPRIRSPSQWPGTARSFASGGRCVIMTSALTNTLPRRVRALGTLRARPVRKHVTSSRRRAPRPCT